MGVRFSTEVAYGFAAEEDQVEFLRRMGLAEAEWRYYEFEDSRITELLHERGYSALRFSHGGDFMTGPGRWAVIASSGYVKDPQARDDIQLLELNEGKITPEEQSQLHRLLQELDLDAGTHPIGWKIFFNVS